MMYPHEEYGFPVAELETKASGESWEVSGYVSTYGRKDIVGDVIVPGAFDTTLSDGHRIRFLYMHDQKQVLGTPLDVHSDGHGVFGRFKISKTRLGEEVHQLLLDGALDSFSIGFITKESDRTSEGLREIRRLDLVESSLVAMPADPRAVVTAFKSPFVLAPEGFEEWLKAEVQRYLDAHASFDPAEMPFDQAWQRITTTLASGVSQAKSLHTRRREEGRSLPERHTQAIQEALRALEGASVELHTLLHAPESPAPITSEPAAEAKPAPSPSLRDEIARRKARIEASVAQSA